MQPNELNQPVSQPKTPQSLTPWLPSQDHFPESLNKRAGMYGGEYHPVPIPDLVFLAPSVTKVDENP